MMDNVFDNVWNTPREPGPRWWTLCSRCGKARVLTVGDYCRRCATMRFSGEYVIVTEDNITKVMAQTGIDGAFLLAKYRNLHELGCFYVLFFARGQWQDITIDEKFHVPTVMMHLFRRLED